MSNARILRIVTFQALGPDSAVDAVLRATVLPRLLEVPAVVDVWQGRRGSADGNHILASTWSTDPPAGPNAPDLSLLADPQLAQLGGTTVVSVETLGIGVHARFTRAEPARVLRVFHGRTRSGELGDYIEEARAGMTADARINDGLVSFVLGQGDDDTFVSVSTWTSWSAIEAATGGTTRQPFATRNSSRLTGYRIVHLELLPEPPSRPTAAIASALEAAT